MHFLFWWTAWLLRAFPAGATHGGQHIIQDYPGCPFTSGNFHAPCVIIFIAWLIRWVLGFVGAFCIINIMLGGFQIAFGSAVGDREAGKSRVFYALVGLFVTIVAYGLLNLIITTLGL